MLDENNPKTVTQKITSLTNMVTWFEGDDFELERALDNYQKAEKLAAEIEHDLMELKNKVTVLKEKFDS